MDNTTHDQLDSTRRELESLRERYCKLTDAYGQIYAQNSALEERLLSIVELHSTEKSQLEHELNEAKQEVIHLKDTVNELEIEKQRYKDDCNLAVRLLHRNPNDFVPPTSEFIQGQMKTKTDSVSNRFNRVNIHIRNNLDSDVRIIFVLHIEEITVSIIID